MIEETALVVAIEGEIAVVETERQSACGACGANKACGTGQIGAVLGQRRALVRALNRAGARRGERVVVAVDEDALLRGSVAVYVAPVVALIFGAGLGTWLGTGLGLPGDTLAIALGLFGLGGGLQVVRWLGQRLAADPRYQPVVLRRAASSPFPVALVQSCPPPD
jgi:sigma-E factor negative regulatory protein RseC